ncbi:DNA/RNA nuclease SfsA [Inmirania thermothiophila]|uniref:Sugar fermentation stimulation protein homolog n=1 Tax=Inmirania thermothiophila TaxID=1750597 RepID=A0A3N1Y1E6_9GAMM|nr:DNA/RNA nuclease SfsA [Inmirania thermothiophila]ROR32663.1 sugar fermentation stimulation protein A [Inmirania thermothiophila]
MRLPPLIEGRLLRRYQRFLADVRLADGGVVTAHTPNTGALAGCCDPGSRVWLSEAAGPRRRCRHTWELVEAAGGVLVGIHTGRAEALVGEAIERGTVAELAGARALRAQVRYGREGSRADLACVDAAGRRCLVEVKNVTLVEGRLALFPDAPTARGRRHLRELARARAEGARALLVYCVQRADAEAVAPAAAIDPDYARAAAEAAAAGVELVAYRAEVGLREIRLVTALPVRAA